MPDGAYDGTWWYSAKDAEGSGFVVGFLDCYGDEYHGRAQFTTKSYDRHREPVSACYARDTASRRAPLARAFQTLGDTAGEVFDSPGGERVTEPHCGSDGLYWMQMSVDADGHAEQRGFVEGYLHCHEALNHNTGASFTKAADAYRALIDKWYRYDEKTGDVDGDQQVRPIADALFAVGDPPR